jgi:hypothetical protein
MLEFNSILNIHDDEEQDDEDTLDVGGDDWEDEDDTE